LDSEILNGQQNTGAKFRVDEPEAIRNLDNYDEATLLNMIG
jgi:hypothetical protein